jgi:hypothetical protein
MKDNQKLDLKTSLMSEFKQHLVSCINDLIFIQDMMGIPQVSTFLRANFPVEIKKLENTGVEL